MASQIQRREAETKVTRKKKNVLKNALTPLIYRLGPF